MLVRRAILVAPKEGVCVRASTLKTSDHRTGAKSFELTDRFFPRHDNTRFVENASPQDCGKENRPYSSPHVEKVLDCECTHGRFDASEPGVYAGDDNVGLR